MIFGLILAEVLLFLAGILLGHPFLGAAAAAALVFVVLAYRQPPLAGALVWIAFPFSIEMRIPGGNAIYAPTEPMMILALLAWALRAPATGPFRIPRSGLNAPLVALAAVALASVALSHYPLLGFKAWVVAVTYAGFAYGFCFLNLGNAEAADRWIPWVVGFGAFWGLFGATRLFLAGISFQHAYSAARPFFQEHGTYSAYLSMILPLGFLAALERSGRNRTLYAGATIAIAVGIALSFTRAAWVAVVLVMPVTALVWALRRRSIRPVAWTAGLALATFLVVLGIGAQGRITRHLGSIGEEQNASNLERLNRWMAAAEMTKDRPLLGVGYGTYAVAYPGYRRKVILTEMAYEHMGAHSEPLRILSETGAVGFVMSLWLLVAAAAIGIRVYRRAPDARASLLALAVLSGLATYAIHSLLNSYPGVDKVTIPFWASLGLLAAMGRELRGASDRSTSRGTSAGA